MPSDAGESMPLPPVIEDAIPEEYRARAAAREAAREERSEATALLRVVPVPEAHAAEPMPARVTVGGGLRGRILAVEGGYGSRRGWGRGGSAQAPVLSTMLGAVAPQTLLAAESVDAVHLPAASDPQTVFTHLRAAARHPGPLLVHLGGHLVADKRGGGLQLTLRDKEGLAWAAVAAELRARPADRYTLVIADLSAESTAWPQLPALGDGLPLWAVVSPDPEQIGIFTRALIECLHGGRPGAGAVLAPEQLRAQVHSVLRPDALVFAGYGQDRPIFKNTARQQAPNESAGSAGPLRPSAAPAALPLPRANRGPVSLLKPGVAPTVRPIRPVTLLKAVLEQQSLIEQQPVLEERPAPVEPPVTPPEDYRDALARIVQTADAGDHRAATELARTLEQQVVAAHGAIAAPVLMVRQVRAHVARLSGDPVTAAELYREVALVLLIAQGPDDPETQRVATNAEACWRAIPDRAQALRTAPAMLELRAQLPGPDGRKLRAAERYAEKLAAE